MPSILTHHLFAKDIKNNLNLDVNNNYYLFAQSHDYLYFNMHKNTRLLAHKAHILNTQNYILDIIQYIKKNNLQNDKNLTSYLYGTITHYVLDSTTHPYIFYKSGLNSQDHREIEKNIDKIYYEEKTNNKYNKIKISKKIILKPSISKELINCLNNTYKNNYNVNNVFKKYIKSIKQSRLIFNITNYDKLSIKIKIYKIVDKLFKTKLYSLSNQIESNDTYLNRNHNIWYHPCTKEKEYTYSFDELYNQSIFKAQIIIKYVNKYINDEIDLEDMKKYIPNISYTTGLLIEHNKKMKYFE